MYDCIHDSVAAGEVCEARHRSSAAPDFAEGAFDRIGGSDASPIAFRDKSSTYESTSGGMRVMVLSIADREAAVFSTWHCRYLQRAGVGSLA